MSDFPFSIPRTSSALLPFKGWYAQTNATSYTVGQNVDFKWDNPIINYREMFTNDGTSSKVTINESGTWYVDCLVNGYNQRVVTHLNRLRGGVTTTLAIGYANTNGYPIYLQTIINGYFELNVGDVITIKNASPNSVQFRGASEGNTWWAGKLVGQ
mgnify:CR=1 FL=1